MNQHPEENRKDLQPTDPELMVRVADGDEVAFEILVRRHEDAVFRLASRILGGNREDAKDVAQEVFISIWDNPKAWKPKALFTTWLYRVTTNRALNKRRSRRLKSIFSLSDYEGDEIPDLNEEEAPDINIEKAEEQREFIRQFNKLPPRQRAALHLKYREELSVAEVAEVLKTSIKSVESLLYRAKQTLRAGK